MCAQTGDALGGGLVEWNCAEDLTYPEVVRRVSLEAVSPCSFSV